MLGKVTRRFGIALERESRSGLIMQGIIAFLSFVGVGMRDWDECLVRGVC